MCQSYKANQGVSCIKIDKVLENFTNQNDKKWQFLSALRVLVAIIHLDLENKDADIPNQNLILKRVNKKMFHRNFLSFSLLFLASCAEIELKPLTDDVKKVFKQNIVTEQEITAAFKQMLEEATLKSINILSSSNGFLNDKDVTIPFPKEAIKLEQTLRKVGFSSLCDEFNTSINLAAEKAVKEATPLFIEAIKNISFTDAPKLLNGGDTAITDYLKRKTTTALVSKFNPIIAQNLEQNKATKNWNKMIKKYNKFPLVKPVQSDLSEHVTTKTIEGLFFYISKVETLIRKDPAFRTTELMKKVFSQAD